MKKALDRRRQGFAAAASLVCVSTLVLGLAGPAGANPSATPQNPLIMGSGSNTTYTMMSALSNLFNSAPGCDQLVASGVQQLDFRCASPPQAAPPGGENGYTLTYPSENPLNAVAFQMPAYGSGNGIKQLEFGGADTLSGVSLTSPSFARSSRAASKPGDKSGLNFVAYAEDAVPWFHIKTLDAVATPSSAVVSLTMSQLQGIYGGTITDWGSVGGKKGNPIDVFMAQSGSGTEGTWVTDLGLTGSFPYAGATATASRTGKPISDFEIFENEVTSIYATGLEADAIFFFSYGKYTLLCPKGKCAGTPTVDGAGKKITASTTTAALGEINKITASKTTIQNGTFALDRELYNAYSDGTNANLPAANLDAQNFVSTYGFLCKPQTATQKDPLSPTGATYLTEIDAIITANGFFPLPLGNEGDGAAGITPPTALAASATYGASDPAPPSDNGYCSVTTTDGDGNL